LKKVTLTREAKAFSLRNNNLGYQGILEFEDWCMYAGFQHNTKTWYISIVFVNA
jgi:hypothetical protein